MPTDKHSEQEFPRVTITELNQDGRGVARLDGKVIFIDGALPGEDVTIRFTKRKKRFDSAELVEVITASPDRVTPPCEYYGLCGGCGLQHLSTEKQIYFKESILRNKLNEFGMVEPEQWLSPLQDSDNGYRRRARLGVRMVPKKGGVLVGFREKNSSYLAVMDGCYVLDQRVSSLFPELKVIIGQLSCPSRIPQIEVSGGDEDIALVIRHLEPLTDADRTLLTDFGEKHNLHIYLQAKSPNNLERLSPRIDKALSYSLPDYDVSFEFWPTGFIQINAAINRNMVKQAVLLLDPQPDENIIDLFCGLGNFTLPFAKKAGHVVGFEADEKLLERARMNAKRNGITNVEFRQANLYDESDNAKLPWDDIRVDKIFLDPPRDGAFKLLHMLPKNGPKRIVYVSCNVVTLARDTEYLVKTKGYKLIKIGLMDMFPHTSHAEAMALFEKA